MRGPSLIAGYLDALAGQLPGAVVEELAAAWRQPTGGTWAWACLPRRRRGPLAGCWRPGRWWGRAGRWRCRYRPVGRAGTAGCAGTAALDGFMIIGVLAADPAARWAVAVAMAASAIRLGLTVRLLRPVLANG